MGVIQFPTKKVQLNRLSAAVARIDAALQEQSEAIAEFRSVNAKLQDKIEALGASLNEYSNNLDNINVGTLGKHSRKLAKIVEPYSAVAAG